MISLLWVLPLLGALTIAISRDSRVASPRAIALAFITVLLVLLGWLTREWTVSGQIEESWTWIPQVGLTLDFWLDGTSLFYTWLVAGIGFLVIQYSGHYMDPSDAPARFYGILLVFLSAMLGLVLSRNMLLMFVFWELTSLTSFLLIGHWHKDAEARKGAKRALVVTGFGGLALMAGIALLAVILNSQNLPMDLRFDSLWQNADILTSHPLTAPALVLLLVGVFTKSAQFPFHFWLPGAMKAPTPVSALLHAATMVKAGIYLLGRIYPIFHDVLYWPILVGGAGIMSMLIGGWLAVLSTDIKKLLACSTVSQLGLLTSYYGFGYQRIGGEDLLKLDLLLVASHALFKAGLFMICGIIDHGTGTREWTKLGGLWRRMPITAALTLLGALTMSGMPLTLGFVAKKLFLEASMALKGLPLIIEDSLLIGAIVASTFTVAYSAILFIKLFLGKPRDSHLYEHAHEGSPGFLVAPAFLIVLCFLGGLYVPIIEKPISLVTNEDFIGADSGFMVAWFAKTDFLFWLSMGMLFIGGPAIIFSRKKMDRIYTRLDSPGPWMNFHDRLFDYWIPQVSDLAQRLVKLQSHKLTLAVLFLTIMVVVGLPMLIAAPPITLDPIGMMEWVAIVVAMGGVAGLVIAISFRNIYARLLGAGVVGLTAASFFMIYKAPDLAITQLLVELVVLLMLLGLIARLRHAQIAYTRPITARIAGAGIAIGIGVVSALLTWNAATSNPHEIWPDRPDVSDYYLMNSYYPEIAGTHSGGGNNVVNVTLVDYRALDTFGEIIVLVAATLGILTLLPPRKRRDPPRHPARPATSLLYLLGLIAPIVSLICVIYAAVLFFAGHQKPGGGFISGLLAGIALIPLMLARKTIRLPRPTVLMAWGIVAASLIGLAPLLYNHPFLRSAFGSLEFPLLGEVKFSTALVFDLGVFLIVLAVTTTLLRRFAIPSTEREDAA